MSYTALVIPIPFIHFLPRPGHSPLKMTLRLHKVPSAQLSHHVLPCSPTGKFNSVFLHLAAILEQTTSYST
ncbi:hypothetical protein Cob_v010851 [Colletotrichum orbiculare MAFF 240422]|uniref:Uncharacterized protein n=1 Tax=Colletotrichum orbiculare (strain 104-T / ATCC 96160 / CBS 514.97 / LARS 414 / MAFF 240422) TaxID=1213857 RepID=A0A484FF72_COLOR|nr:hypothetical protein Cob_v010851 [Colletotrichum orbiculare MAFF 240422]